MSDSQKEQIDFQSLSDSQKTLLLELLDFGVDSQGFITDSSSNRVVCRYTHEFVSLKTASILPGSTIIINTSAYTLSSYMSEFLEAAEDDAR